VTVQNNGNEQEQTQEEMALAEQVAEEAEANGDSVKRRGRAARRRRREESQAVLVPARSDDDEDDVSSKKAAPTPGRRQKERANIVQRATRPVTNYFQETVSELRKVSWPTREESMRLSGVVLGVTAISAISLGLYSFLLDRGLEILLSLLS
jgi:preprotein translocase subunit SecE